jgi:tetratricopeptide (TPR) repeat protein/S1-C subfamily serine protease
MNTSKRLSLVLGISLVGATALIGCGSKTDQTNKNTTTVLESAANNTSCSHGNITPNLDLFDKKIQQVSEIARAVTVCITSQTPGSGVIIKRQGDVYTILTAAHVVATEDKYKLVAPDGKLYEIDYSTIKRFPGKIDLAILQFASKQDYRVVEIGDSTKAVTGTTSYVAGFPLQSEESIVQTYSFSSGEISANASRLLEAGYGLAYENDTFSGMSGGPVLDGEGRLIGIHGRVKVSSELFESKGISRQLGIKLGLNMAIPIHTFLSLITQVEPNLGFQSVSALSIPPQPTADDFFLQGIDRAIADNLQGAIADFDKAISFNHNYVSAYLNRGAARADLGDTQGAIADYDKAISLNPNYALAYLNRGVARSKLGAKRGAIADYDKAISLNPNDALSYNNRGVARSELGDKKGAIADYDKAISLNPNYATAYNNRGIVRADLGDQRGAIADYDKAISLNPNDATAYNNRGIVRADLGDQRGAIADFDKAISLNPNYVSAYLNRGNARSLLGDEQGAIADYDKAISINPNFAVAYYNRGLARSELGDKQGAITDFDKAISLNPNYVSAYLDRGFARAALGDKKGAIADYDKAILLNPNYALAYNNRAIARFDLGDKKGAVADFDKAISLNPNFADAYYNRGKARSLLGDKKGAIADLQKAADLFQTQGDRYGHQETLDLLSQISH